VFRLTVGIRAFNGYSETQITQVNSVPINPPTHVPKPKGDAALSLTLTLVLSQSGNTECALPTKLMVTARCFSDTGELLQKMELPVQVLPSAIPRLLILHGSLTTGEAIYFIYTLCYHLKCYMSHTKCHDDIIFRDLPIPNGALSNGYIFHYLIDIIYVM
jgi:hypothetical protein